MGIEHSLIGDFGGSVGGVCTVEPVLGREAHTLVRALEPRSVRLPTYILVVGPLLKIVFFIGINLVICLVDSYAFATDALGHTPDLGRLNGTLVVKDPSDAVIVCVTDVHLHVPTRLIVQG